MPTLKLDSYNHITKFSARSQVTNPDYIDTRRTNAVNLDSERGLYSSRGQDDMLLSGMISDNKS